MINPDMHSGGGSRSSNEIESDIRRTRGRMDATLDQLSERLTARSVVHTLLDIWEARQPSTPAGEVRTRKVYGALSKQVANQVRDNPIPTLLIGAGIAWMFLDREREIDDREYVEMSGRRYRVRPSHPSGPAGAMSGTPVGEYEYEEVEYENIDHGPSFMDRAKEKFSHGKDVISDAASSVKDRITGAGHAAKERVSEFGEAARERVDEISGAAHETADAARRRARETYYRGRASGREMGHTMKEGYATGAERFNQAVDEYPLGVGIGFAALGALMGLLLPHTRREDELLGERSDELVDVVKEKGRETLERTKVVAERVAETALEEAQKQGLTAETVGQKLSDLASRAGEVAKRAKDEAVQAAEEQGLTPEQLKSEVQEAEPSTTPSSSTIPSSGISSGEGYSINTPPTSTSSQGSI